MNLARNKNVRNRRIIQFLMDLLDRFLLCRNINHEILTFLSVLFILWKARKVLLVVAGTRLTNFPLSSANLLLSKLDINFQCVKHSLQFPSCRAGEGACGAFLSISQRVEDVESKTRD